MLNIPKIIFESTGSKNTSDKIGGFLCYIALAITCITSSMFLTALAPNLLALEIATKSGFSGVSWLSWMLSFLPVGIILFIITPFLAKFFYRPDFGADIKGDYIQHWAQNELKKMGKISLKEILMIAIAFFALIFWIFGSKFGLHATTVGLSAMILMVLFKIISWNDVVSNKQAWNVLAWFGSLITLASGIKTVGFLDFIAKGSGVLSALDPIWAMTLGVIAFFILHYFFASVTAHVSALLALFIAIFSQISGVDLNEFTLFLLLSLGIMGIITPYGTGPSPVWVGSGYIKTSSFWNLGAIFGAIYLSVFLIIGLPWISYLH